jgi:glycopeptide antibiotics resistance protein
LTLDGAAHHEEAIVALWTKKQEDRPSSPPPPQPRASRWSRRAPETRRPARQPAPPPRAVRWGVMLLAFVGMVAFAVVLARVTLVPSPASASLAHANFHPGATIRAYLDQPGFRDAVRQIGGNILLGMPFGLLLPTLLPKVRGPIRVVLVTALVMLAVETAQGTLVRGRAFDVDDVILNTFGALVGYLLAGRSVNRAVHPKRRRFWQRDDRDDRADARRDDDRRYGRHFGRRAVN